MSTYCFEPEKGPSSDLLCDCETWNFAKIQIQLYCLSLELQLGSGGLDTVPAAPSWCLSGTTIKCHWIFGMNHGPQCTSPAQPQHSRSVNHDRDSAHCSLTPAIVPAMLHALQSPRAPADPALLQRCSCRGSSCCVMINEAMKHAPHLTVPRVHSVYTYRVSTNTHRAQPSSPSGTVSSSSQCRYWRYHSLTHHGCCSVVLMLWHVSGEGS